MRSLVVLGAGGHARELLDLVDAVNAASDPPAYSVVGVLAAGADEAVLRRRGVAWVGDLGALVDLHPHVAVAVGVGLPWTRRAVVEQVEALGAGGVTDRDLPVLLHPTATVGSANELGPGFVAQVGACVTTNVRTGRHVHLNVNAVVSHDCVLGDFVTVSPGALVNGDVVLEDDVFVGSGAVVGPRVRVGRGAKVAAGAVVVRDVPPGVTARGVPARW